MNRSFWNNKCVLLTGHTGFKGGWLSLWLQSMGAHIHGYALNPTTDLNFFTLADVESGMASNTIADIRDTQKLSDLILRVNPDIVFHMAAQPFVRDSYSNPVETFDINVMGTVSLLEAVRYSPSVRALVNITTDKCYENNERLEAYHEDDALGGYDPYSSSKACSELVTAAYRRSFFSQKSVGIATARAGNVIGGGDWSPDRLIPDFFRAIAQNKPLVIRYPNAIRPWQHVLESLSGYLILAEKLYIEPNKYAGAWNFGPLDGANESVLRVLDKLIKKIPGSGWEADKKTHLHEASLLKLDSKKAKIFLDWTPRWSLDEAINKIVEWQKEFELGSDLKKISLLQISEYINGDS